MSWRELVNWDPESYMQIEQNTQNVGSKSKKSNSAYRKTNQKEMDLLLKSGFCCFFLVLFLTKSGSKEMISFQNLTFSFVLLHFFSKNVSKMDDFAMKMWFLMSF